VRAWKASGGWEAKAAQLPMLGRVHAFADVRATPATRRRDPGNWYPTAKAVIDGVIAAGRLLPDDDSSHLVGPDMRMGAPVARGTPVQLVLWFVDLTSLPPGEEP